MIMDSRMKRINFISFFFLLVVCSYANVSATHHSGFYLKDSDGKEKKLKGSMLWGLGRKSMVMRKNVVVIFYRNKKKEYELITYEIIDSTLREVKRERYPYEMAVNSWDIQKIIFSHAMEKYVFSTIKRIQ